MEETFKKQNKTLQIHAEIRRGHFYEGFEEFDRTSHDPFAMYALPCGTCPRRRVRSKARTRSKLRDPAPRGVAGHDSQNNASPAKAPLAPCASAGLIFSQKSLFRWR